MPLAYHSLVILVHRARHEEGKKAHPQQLGSTTRRSRGDTTVPCIRLGGLVRLARITITLFFLPLTRISMYHQVGKIHGVYQ